MFITITNKKKEINETKIHHPRHIRKKKKDPTTTPISQLNKEMKNKETKLAELKGKLFSFSLSLC
jgi:hypothetical protein